MLRLMSTLFEKNKFDSEISICLEENERTGLDGKVVSKISGVDSSSSYRSVTKVVSGVMPFSSEAVNDNVST